MSNDCGGPKFCKIVIYEQPGTGFWLIIPIKIWHQAYEGKITNWSLMLLVANLANTKWCKKNTINDWSPGIWVLIWEYSASAIQWIPTWPGLDGHRKSLRPCALDKSSLSTGRVNYTINYLETLKCLVSHVTEYVVSYAVYFCQCVIY